MPKTSPIESGSAYPRENPKHWVGVEAEDIPQGWMDDMVKRLFDLLNRRLIRLENAQKAQCDGKDPLDYKKEAEFSRLAAQMRTDLEKLRKMEMKRQSKKPQVKTSDDDIRRDLQRRIDRLAATEETGPDSGGPDS